MGDARPGPLTAAESVRPFRRSRGQVTASFEANEAALLADLVDQLRQVLSQRRSQRSDDPLAEITGMAVGPTSAPEDPALARLLPDFSADDPDLSAGLRTLREPDLIADKDAAAVALLDSLPLHGGSVHLSAEQGRQWLAALNDLRLILGVRLEVSEEQDEPAAVRADPEGPAAMSFTIYRWLTYLQDSLVGALLR